MAKKNKGNKASKIDQIDDFKDRIWCLHKRDVIPIGKNVILASEYFSTADILKPPVPDTGVYLCDLWDKFFEEPRIFGKLTDFGQPTFKPPFPAIIVPWTDRGVIEMDMLMWLVNGIIAKMEAGKLVEVGCLGGHGRTGTLIACVLGKVENLTARQAILTLRDRYCEKVVETAAQCLLIAAYLSDPDPFLAELKQEAYVPPIRNYSSYGGGDNIPYNSHAW